MIIEKLARRIASGYHATGKHTGRETRQIRDLRGSVPPLIVSRQARLALKKLEGIGGFVTPFDNDPPSIVALAFAELYPDKEYDAQIVPDIRDDKGVPVCGCTTFSTDPNERPLVEISGQLPLVHVPEILAHELAHVATSTINEHGREWEAAFEAILKRYDEIIGAIFDDVIVPPEGQATPSKGQQNKAN